MGHRREPRNGLRNTVNWCLIKKQREFNGEIVVFLTNFARKRTHTHTENMDIDFTLFTKISSK